MLTRAFNAAGLIVRIAEWKARLLAFGARRSAIALMGALFAAILALGGMAILLGAGYVALEAIVGVPTAMAIIGAFLLIVASIIWIIAQQKGANPHDGVTEIEARKQAARDEESLRAALGLTQQDGSSSGHATPGARMARPATPVPPLDAPKVLMAAGFAALGLLGPVRLLRTVRIATTLASITALAKRAIDERPDAQVTPRPPDSEHHSTHAPRVPARVRIRTPSSGQRVGGSSI